jgi:hypothetical protein
MHRFDGAPMMQPIMFKTAIYWLCVLVVRLAEGLVHFLSAGGLITDFPAHVVEHFSWARFLSIQIWLMVLFLARLRLRPPRRVYWHYIAEGLARSFDALHTTAKSRLGWSKYVSGSFGTSPYKALAVSSERR